MPFLAIGLVGYVRCRALCLDQLAQPIGVIGFVAEKDIAFAQIAQQGVGAQQIVGLARDLRRGLWTQSRHGFELKGKTLGVIGVGPIDRRFGQMAQALGMDVMARSRRPSSQRAALPFGIAIGNLERFYDGTPINIVAGPKVR